MVTQAQLRQVQAQRFNIPRSQNVSAPFTAPTNTPKTGVPNTTPSSTSTVKKKGDLLDAPLSEVERLALERNSKLTPDKFPTTAEYKVLQEKFNKGKISTKRPNVSTPSELERFRSANFVLNARTERLSKQLAVPGGPSEKTQDLFESLPEQQRRQVSQRIDKTSFSGADRQDDRQTQVQQERADDFGGLSGGFQQRKPGLQSEGVFIREKNQTAFQAGKSQGSKLPKGSVERVRQRFDTRTNLSVQPVLSTNERSSTRVLSGSTGILDTGVSRTVEARQVGTQESRFTGGQGTISPTPDSERQLRILGIPTPFKEPSNLLRRSEEIAIQARRERIATGKESKTTRALAFSTGIFEGLVVAPLARTSDVLKGFVTTILKPVETFKTIRQDIRTSPESSGGQLVGSLALGKGVVKGTGVGLRGVRAGTTAIKTNFRPNIPGEITGSPAISTITVETSAGPKTIQVSGAIGSKTLPSEPVSVAVARAGTKVDAVSAARDFFRPQDFAKEINKPLPDPKASPLERSFFLDPETRLRLSRLGLTQTNRPATLQDIATGDFSILPQKPQAIIIPDLPVQKFPKSLIDIETSLKTGKPLTPAQQQRLLNFQLEPSGQAKPVGFISTEPEVTIAPGEVLVRVGNSQQTLLPKKGSFFPEPVEIIEAQVLQANKAPKSSIVIGGDIDAAKASGLRISRLPSESPRLRIESSASSGFVGRPEAQTSIISSSPRTRSPLDFKTASSVSSIPKPSRDFLSRDLGTSKVPATSPPVRPPSRTRTSTVSSPLSISPTTASPVSPVSTTPSPLAPSPSITPKIPQKTTTQRQPDKPFRDLSRSQKKQAVVKAFDVFLKSKGEFKKVASGLPRGLALRAGRSAALGSLAATFKLRERGTTTRRDVAFDKKQLGDVFREYKIRQGQKVITPDTFIQRRGKRLKTSKERSLIQRARKKSSSKGFFGKPSGGLL